MDPSSGVSAQGQLSVWVVLTELQGVLLRMKRIQTSFDCLDTLQVVCCCHCQCCGAASLECCHRMLMHGYTGYDVLTVIVRWKGGA